MKKTTWEGRVGIRGRGRRSRIKEEGSGDPEEDRLTPATQASLSQHSSHHSIHRGRTQ